MPLLERIARAIFPATGRAAPVARALAPAPIPASAVKTAPLISTLSEWDLDAVTTAIDAHERGEFEQSAKLAQYCKRQASVLAPLRVRRDALAALPFTMEPADTTPEGKRAADLFAARWPECFPEWAISGILESGVLLGFAVAQVRWISDGGLWWPRLDVWPSDAIRYYDERGQWVALDREGEETPIDDSGAWFLYLPAGPRSFQGGAILAVGVQALLEIFAERDHVNFNEAASTILRRANVPRNVTQAEKDSFSSQLRQLGRTSTTLVCDQALDGSQFGFELLAPDTKALDTFKVAGEIAALKISRVLLGNTLTTGTASNGNRALGEVHAGTQAALTRSDAESLSTALRDQVLRAWAAWNFGDADLAPWPRWQTAPPADQSELAQQVGRVGYSIGAARASLAGTGIKLDVAALLERTGIPYVPGDDVPPALAADLAAKGADLPATPPNDVPAPPAQIPA